MHSFEIFLATTVVFWGSGTVGYTLLEYRLGKKKLVRRSSSSSRDFVAHLKRHFTFYLFLHIISTARCLVRESHLDTVLVSFFSCLRFVKVLPRRYELIIVDTLQKFSF